MMATHNWQSEFENGSEAFKQGNRVEEFKTTSFKELQMVIGDIQAEQHSSRRLQGLSRLEPFLEAAKQFSTVVQLFCSNNDVVAFIWAPLKFLLMATKTEPVALNEVINAYESIGESLPMCLQYRSVFLSEPHMVKVLKNIYDKLLEFHSVALKYFQRARWQDQFDNSWATRERWLFTISSNIDQQRSLIESRASPIHVEDVQNDLQGIRQQDNEVLEKETARCLHIVTTWLSPTDVETYQEEYAKIRAEYPGTGRWLLDNPSFKEWFDPQIAIIPPLLWLTGMPGAGKTMLASLVVEEASNLHPAPTLLYFFFKYDNMERNNFMSLARSLLMQLLMQNKEALLPVFYQKCCLSGKTALTSSKLMEELLHLAFDHCKSAYIVLDGLDECERDQQKTIAKWFKDLVEALPRSDAAKLRCLFVGRDDGVSRKDFADISTIKIREEGTKRDIYEYSRVEASKLKESFDVSGEKASEIVGIVVGNVQGLFLLAKLIWINLSCQTSIMGLEEELEPGNFPKEIYEAYHRIMVRIRQHTSGSAMKDIMMLFSWLVCAKRDLKWHEIQGMKSINLGERSISFAHQRFRKGPKDLCGSLVELHPDGSVQFVHSTAKHFLIEAGHVIPSSEEFRMACLCVEYLNFPAFIDPPTEARVLNGDYGFMDYAVLHWHRHLEAATTMQYSVGDEELMRQLAESLEKFIQEHWCQPTVALVLAKRHSDKLEFFKPLPFYNKLEIILASTKNQLRFFGNVRTGAVALDLVDIVASVRNVLRQVISSTDGPSMAYIEQMYGNDLFKCPRFGCHCFTTGFESDADLKEHKDQHDRPFRCPKEGCYAFTLGFSSAGARNKHMKKTHKETLTQDRDVSTNEEFPTEEDVQRSIEEGHVEAATDDPEMTDNIQHQSTDEPVATDDLEVTDNIQHQSTDEPAAMSTTKPMGPNSDSNFEVEPVHRWKRQRQAELICPYCSKKFTTRSNLQSHEVIHGPREVIKCPSCPKTFIRNSDYKRHARSHTGEKEYVCRGRLGNGQPWGCGNAFARADTLQMHQRSCIYQACHPSLLEEQGVENVLEGEQSPGLENRLELEQGVTVVVPD